MKRYFVSLLKKGNCDAKESHENVDVMEVEDLVAKTTLTLCPKCFNAQQVLASKAKKVEAEKTPANGWQTADTGV